jgi:6-pyruvoyl-tetrahydropterin synthase
MSTSELQKIVSKPVMRYMGMMANVKNVHGHSYKLSVTVIESYREP